MLIPAAVVAGYLVGRKAPAAAATAGSIEWEDHFAMMATAGVPACACSINLVPCIVSLPTKQ